MIIKVGEGIDKIKFGMKPKEVIHILGKPDMKCKGKEWDRYFYNKLMIELSFARCKHNDPFRVMNQKMCYIAVMNPKVRLGGKKVIGMSKQQLSRLLDNHGIKSKLYEWANGKKYKYDYIFCEEIEFLFEFEYDKLRRVSFGFLEDEEKILWSKNKH